MTFDERLEEIFEIFWVGYENDFTEIHKRFVAGEITIEQQVEESEVMWARQTKQAISAIKQAMRETVPRHRTVQNMPIDEWLEKHPHVSPNLSHEARLQVAASRMFGWNECVDEIEKGFGL